MGLPDRDIRFTSTDDGVDIAYWEIGEGKPVVILNNFSISHAELEWTVPSIASFYMDMADSFRVIRFDPRGMGLSGLPPGGLEAVKESGAQQGMSTHEMGLDIDAVASALELDAFTILAIAAQGLVAIEYAATHPEVTELILCESFATTASSYMSPVQLADVALSKIEADTGQKFSVWEKFVPPEETDQVLNLLRNVAEGPRERGTFTQMEWDAEPFLNRISVPTLVLCTRNLSADTLPDSRHLAAGIEASQLRVLDGRGVAPYFSDRTATLEAVAGFLKPELPTGRLASDFQTVVFTDVVGSTEYFQRVGDEAGRTATRELEAQIASLASDHGGRVIKNLGDGSLVSFGSNSSAITFALDLQTACDNGPLRIRVGMAAGEPIQEAGDIHGTVVAQASRIGDLGDAGEVLTSDAVCQLAVGKGFEFEPRGEVSLKGFDQPQKVWRVTHP